MEGREREMVEDRRERERIKRVEQISVCVRETSYREWRERQIEERETDRGERERDKEKVELRCRVASRLPVLPSCLQYTHTHIHAHT